MMENLFNVLCSSLMETSNRDKFLRGEGLQLMNLMLREKKLSRYGSLKVIFYQMIFEMMFGRFDFNDLLFLFQVLDHAMTGIDGKDNCNKFVDILGLRTIFPLFMKTPSKNRKKVLTVEQHEGI